MAKKQSRTKGKAAPMWAQKFMEFLKNIFVRPFEMIALLLTRLAVGKAGTEKAIEQTVLMADAAAEQQQQENMIKVLEQNMNDIIKNNTLEDIDILKVKISMLENQDPHPYVVDFKFNGANGKESARLYLDSNLQVYGTNNTTSRMLVEMTQLIDAAIPKSLDERDVQIGKPDRITVSTELLRDGCHVATVTSPNGTTLTTERPLTDRNTIVLTSSEYSITCQFNPDTGVIKVTGDVAMLQNQEMASMTETALNTLYANQMYHFHGGALPTDASINDIEANRKIGTAYLSIAENIKQEGTYIVLSPTLTQSKYPDTKSIVVGLTASQDDKHPGVVAQYAAMDNVASPTKFQFPESMNHHATARIMENFCMETANFGTAGPVIVAGKDNTAFVHDVDEQGKHWTYEYSCYREGETLTPVLIGKDAASHAALMTCLPQSLPEQSIADTSKLIAGAIQEVYKNDKALDRSPCLTSGFINGQYSIPLSVRPQEKTLHIEIENAENPACPHVIEMKPKELKTATGLSKLTTELQNAFEESNRIYQEYIGQENKEQDGQEFDPDDGR